MFFPPLLYCSNNLISFVISDFFPIYFLNLYAKQPVLLYKKPEINLWRCWCFLVNLQYNGIQQVSEKGRDVPLSYRMPMFTVWVILTLKKFPFASSLGCSAPLLSLADNEKPVLDLSKHKSAFLQNSLEQGPFLKYKYLMPLTIV